MKKVTGAITILGGMGPEASAKLLEVMVSMAATEFKAINGNDFPEIIVDSVPVPDFINSKRKLELAKRMLSQRLRKLEVMNPNCFAIACNTAHILLDDLQRQTSTPFVSIIDEAVKVVRQAGISKVGVLATPVAIKSGLFQKALFKINVTPILPNKNQGADLEKIIREVIAGKVSINEQRKLKRIAESLQKQGAEGIILGCTELPLVPFRNSPLPTFDSMEILSRALLTKFFKERR